MLSSTTGPPSFTNLSPAAMDYRTHDTEAARKSVFLQLKPHCIAVSQLALGGGGGGGGDTNNPAAANQGLTKELGGLLEVVRAVSTSQQDVLTQPIGDYIFFPLSHVFRQHQKLSDRVIELALQILDILIRTCWRIEVPKELAKQLVILVTFIVGGPPGTPSQQNRASEECKIAGCSCLEGLFRSISLSNTCRGMFFEEQNLPATGHLVSTLLETLVDSVDSVELGTIAMKALKVLLEDCLTDVDVLASFLPGIVSQFSKILAPQKRSTRRSSTIIAGTINLLASVLYRVLTDLDGSNTIAITEKESAKKEGLKVTRTKSWFTATSSQVKTALEGIIARNRSHSKSAVRSAILQLCFGLLTNCIKAMESSQAIGLLVDTLVILAGDEDEDIARLSSNSLQTLAVTVPTLGETLQQSVHGWVVSLPRVMQSNDEDIKAKLVQRISAGLKILTDMGVESSVLQDIIAQNIRDSLESTQAFSGKQAITTQFNPSSELISLRSTNKENGSSNQYPDLILAHRTQKETIASLKQLLKTIGATSSTTVLDLADRYIRESRDGSPVALWIAVNLMRSTVQKSTEVDQWLDMRGVSTDDEDGLLEELFAVSIDLLTNTTAATAYIPDDGTDSTITTCLSMEAISLFAEKHGEGFRHELVDVIYPIVHLLGSASPTVQRHAMITLNNISLSCEYQSPQELILDNMDYLVNAIALKLNTFDISPQAPAVLGMMVKLTGKSILPFLGDVVESIFAALGNYHGYEDLCRSLFGVLKDVVDVSVEGDDEIKKIEGRVSSQHNEKRERLTVDKLLERLKGDLEREERTRREIKELEEAAADIKKGEFPRVPWAKPKEEKKFDPEAYLNGEMDMDDGGGEDGEDGEDGAVQKQDEKPPEPTQTYKLIQKITRLTQHYLTHPSPVLRLQLLQLVGTSSVLLAQNEREFLPLVNDVWPVLFVRLFDDEAHVVIGAAHTIADLARVCGDFISSRVSDGWKKGGKAGFIGGGENGGIRRLLVDTKAKVLGDKKGMGVFSTDYRIWEALLDMLGDIVRGCHFDDAMFDEILDIVGDSLEGKPELRSALEEVNADAVWVREEWRRSLEVGGVDQEERYGPKPVLEGIVFPDVEFGFGGCFERMQCAAREFKSLPKGDKRKGFDKNGIYWG
ncbi:armadillo-type protein [Peziza echinospora]|nr:armadillo-type protein [Peziza echinospora]